MDYHLEQLGDERFQKLCQAILVLFHPNVLCLPVGQPDGGRDAFVKKDTNKETEAHIVFQVKYVNDPKSRDSRDFIKKIIASEGEKVKELKSRGMNKYYLLTNVAGTSHQDTGSIDIINKELSEALDVDAYCWWRDDLERRIDSNRDLKWSFPEILKATDLLGELLDSRLDESAKRRSDTLRSYMAHQARYDAHLKFKQVELQKGIIEQFVDIPSCFTSAQNEDQQNIQSFVADLLKTEKEKNPDMYNDEDEDEDTFGALQIMVNSELSNAITRTVIEGAPGQGKSTVTQYLCQVHRLVLLGKPETAKIFKLHLPQSARIPFRIDLRDYASWLSGRNPFSDTTSENKQTLNPLLECFIAAQVNRYTGAAFTVDDLNAISNVSQILIVLDGFDEVADIKIRNKIVSEVSDAAYRIHENSISAQIIVTSRPTAFSNSPGFSRSEWQHLTLLPLTSGVINLYAQKWLDGRAIENKEREEIISVLNEKLTQTHVKDLARNPMQLAILLALISVQGASLPDKRTALYDNYIDIFLNRESEKSKVVRDHRELLIQIHRYLAWVLQSEAEEKSEAGNISENRLKEILRVFLDDSGHPTSLVDELFSGMVERVVALVSRVQGTFEFEVQPLREYFAARYLYDTAPYSPAGVVKKGTLPERFDAIARNFYWLNVTRFYAGCYSSGELSSLIDGLEELSASYELKNIGQPSKLGILLLKDYVFNQHPKLAKRVTSNIVKCHGFRALLANIYSRGDSDTLTLPEGASKTRLIEECRELLLSNPKSDAIYVLSNILVNNCHPEILDSIWSEIRLSSKNTTLTILSGAALETFERLDKTEVLKLIEDFGERILFSILRHQRFDLFIDDDILCDIFIRQALDTRGQFVFFSKTSAPLPQKIIAAYGLVLLGSNYLLSQLLHGNTERTINSLMHNQAFRGHLSAVEAHITSYDANQEPSPNIYSKIIHSLSTLYETKLCDIRTELATWSATIELFKEAWGDSKTLNSIAINIFSFLDVSLIDRHSPINSQLLRRTLTTKENINNISWLKESLNENTNHFNDDLFLIQSTLSWSSVSTILSLSTTLSTIIDGVEDETWATLVGILGTRRYTLKEPESYETCANITLPLNISKRLASLLILVVDEESKFVLWDKYLKSYDGDDVFVIEAMLAGAVDAAWENPSYWEFSLALIKSAYSKDIGYHLQHSRKYDEDPVLPLKLAREICENPQNYPFMVVSTAETTLLANIGEAIVPVGKTAYINEWFQ